jgi:hypothetical protein
MLYVPGKSCPVGLRHFFIHLLFPPIFFIPKGIINSLAATVNMALFVSGRSDRQCEGYHVITNQMQMISFSPYLHD